VVLKRIRNPVPMYAKRSYVSLPERDQWFGFDLEVADWVAPNGRGSIADIELLGTGEVIDERNYTGRLRMRFPGKGNGLIMHRVPDQPQVSAPRLPYTAPEVGYESEYVWERMRRVDDTSPTGVIYRDGQDETENFFLRVRSKWDEEQQLTSAWYGKLHGPTKAFVITRFLEGGPWKMALQFTHYVNPDGTRNVEFDPKQNLLKPRTRREESHYRGLGP